MTTKILYVSFGNPLTEIGGIEKYLYTLIVNLKSTFSNQIEIFVAFPVFTNEFGYDCSKENPLFMPIRIKIPLPRKKFFLPISKLMFNIYLANYVHKNGNKYDILHIHGDNGTLAFKFFKGKKFFSLHGNSAAYYRIIKEKLSPFKRIPLLIATAVSGFIETFGVTHSDVSFSDQKEVIEYFKRKTRMNNLVFLSNFVDTNLFSPCDDRYEVKRKLGLSYDKHYSLWIGTAPLRKRLDLAVQTINESDNFTLIVIGPEIYFGEKIVNFGFVKDQTLLIDIYRASDIILFTSSHEGQSIALLESIATGCVPIIRKSLSIPGFVDGYNCFLVDDDNSFTSTISSLEKNIELLDIMSKNVRSLAVELYSVDTGIKNISKFYEL